MNVITYNRNIRLDDMEFIVRQLRSGNSIDFPCGWPSEHQGGTPEEYKLHVDKYIVFIAHKGGWFPKEIETTYHSPLDARNVRIHLKKNTIFTNKDFGFLLDNLN